MTFDRSFGREPSELLQQLETGPIPDYRDDIVQRTASIRQRPAWMFPERWLPMSAVSSWSGASPRFRWRPVGLLGLIVVALAASALFVVGSVPRLPALFGPAANGLVIFSSNGDIYAVDPATGSTRVIVTGPGWDIEPRWSRDGTRFLFERRTNDRSSSEAGLLYVALADGSEITQITPDPRTFLESAAFSPDGKQVMFTSDASRRISIAAVDGSGVIRTLDLPTGVSQALFRPPDGDEIVALVGDSALYAVRADGTGVRPLVDSGCCVGSPAWSPDGSRLAYFRWTPSTVNTARAYILSADGKDRRAVATPMNVLWDAEAAWSNDGTRLVLVRGYSPTSERVVAAVVSADEGGLGVETDLSVFQGRCNTNVGCGRFEWAPDDTSILLTAFDALGQPAQQTLIDPVTGQVRSTLWATTSGPSWQRLAP
jgi:Tol biopolymer transport system component